MGETTRDDKATLLASEHFLFHIYTEPKFPTTQQLFTNLQAADYLQQQAAT